MRLFNNKEVSLKTISIYKFNNNYRNKEVRNIVIKKNVKKRRKNKIFYKR